MCFNSQAMSLGIQQKPKLREISLVPNNLILFLGIQSMPNTREHILLLTVFALAVMEYAVGVSKFGKNPMTLLVHQY